MPPTPESRQQPGGRCSCSTVQRRTGTGAPRPPRSWPRPCTVLHPADVVIRRTRAGARDAARWTSRTLAALPGCVLAATWTADLSSSGGRDRPHDSAARCGLAARRRCRRVGRVRGGDRDGRPGPARGTVAVASGRVRPSWGPGWPPARPVRADGRGRRRCRRDSACAAAAPGRPSAPATRPETRCASARSSAAPLASDAAMADRASRRPHGFAQSQKGVSPAAAAPRRR